MIASSLGILLAQNSELLCAATGTSRQWRSTRYACLVSLRERASATTASDVRKGTALTYAVLLIQFFACCRHGTGTQALSSPHSPQLPQHVQHVQNPALRLSECLATRLTKPNKGGRSTTQLATLRTVGCACLLRNGEFLSIYTHATTPLLTRTLRMTTNRRNFRLMHRQTARACTQQHWKLRRDLVFRRHMSIVQAHRQDFSSQSKVGRFLMGTTSALLRAENTCHRPPVWRVSKSGQSRLDQERRQPYSLTVVVGRTRPRLA
jgi:hypothetical protein